MTVTTDRSDAPFHDHAGDYRCPACESRLTHDHQSWTCRGCGFVPHHPAD